MDVFGHRVINSEAVPEVFGNNLRRMFFQNVSCVYNPVSGQVLMLSMMPMSPHEGIYHEIVWVDPQNEVAYREFIHTLEEKPLMIYSCKSALTIARHIEAGLDTWDRDLLCDVEITFDADTMAKLTAMAEAAGVPRKKYINDLMQELFAKIGKDMKEGAFVPHQLVDENQE